MAYGFKTGGPVIRKVSECGICHKVKPRSEFYQVRGRISCGNCKDCEQKRRRSQPGYHLKMAYFRHDWWLRKNYGITLEDYFVLLKKQKGKCAICGTKKKTRGRRWHDVDHDHKKMKVRGILCASCNHGIGALKDSIKLLKKAIAYLEAHL